MIRELLDGGEGAMRVPVQEDEEPEDLAADLGVDDGRPTWRDEARDLADDLGVDEGRTVEDPDISESARRLFAGADMTAEELEEEREYARERREEREDPGLDIPGPTITDVGRGLRDLLDPSEPAEWVPGVTEMRETERFQEMQRELAEEDSRLGRFDLYVQAGTDFLLDHPRASVRRGTRGLLGRATGLEDEELAERAQEIDEGITEGIDRRIEGTPFDHRGTDAVRWVGDTLIGEGVRVMTGAFTGIDTREGDLEARTGALEAADVGLTIGTAGVGRVAVGGLRAARAGEGITTTFRAGRTGRTTSDAPSLLERVTAPLTRTADDAAAPAVRATDDVATAATRTSDDLLPVLHRSEIDQALPAVARTADDAAGLPARVADRVAAPATRAADDAGGFVRRAADQVGPAVTRTTDRIGAAATRVGQRARAAGTGRGARIAAAGGLLGGGIVAGGALVQQLQDRYVMEDGTVLVMLDTFQPTEEFEGGLLYRVKEEDGPTIGYSVVVAQQGRNLIMLDASGEPVRAPLDVEELAAHERRGGA